MKIKKKSETEKAIDTRKSERAKEAEGALSLVKRAIAEREVKELEAKKLEAEYQKKAAELIEREEELVTQIDAGKKQVESMANEYEAIRKEKEQANLAELSKSELTKSDVKSGKISATEFVQKGKEDEEIAAMAGNRTQLELSELSDAIREKNHEITKWELELSDIQCKVFSMTFQPARILRETYRIMTEYLDFNMSPHMENLHSASATRDQRKNELSLIEHGVNLSGSGYVWMAITKKAAKRLQHSPILPKEHVSMLLQKLDAIEGDETQLVTIEYHHPESYWPGDSIIVRGEY